MDTDQHQDKDKPTVGVLGYATPARRSHRQSPWGMASVVCGVMVPVVLVGMLALGSSYVEFGGAPGNWLFTVATITTFLVELGTILLGLTSGIVGLVQRQDSRKAAIIGLAICTLEMVVLGVLG